MPSLTVKGTRVSYSETGAGPTVVALHCSAGTKGQWARLQEYLDDRFHVVAPDLYGHGGTDPWAGNSENTLADEATLVAALMSLSDEPVHLIGHSYGGAVALRVAQQWPGRLRSLTLIEPVAFYLLRGIDPRARALAREVSTLARTVTDAAQSGAGEAGMAYFVDYWNGQGAWAQLPEETRASLSGQIDRVALNFRAIEAERTSLAAYRRLFVPTLIVSGDASPAPTRYIAARLAAAIPIAHELTIRGAGHMAPLSHAEMVNAAIDYHLARGAVACRAAA